MEIGGSDHYTGRIISSILGAALDLLLGFRIGGVLEEGGTERGEYIVRVEMDELENRASRLCFIYLPGCWYLNIGFRFYSLFSVSASRSSSERSVPSITVRLPFPSFPSHGHHRRRRGWYGAVVRCWCVGKGYRLPNFSNARVPCSSHSCLEIHMFSLSAIYGER